VTTERINGHVPHLTHPDDFVALTKSYLSS